MSTYGQPPPGLEHATSREFERVLVNELGFELVEENALPPNQVNNNTRAQVNANANKKKKNGFWWNGLLLFLLVIIASGATVGGLFVSGVFDVVETNPTISPTSAPTTIPTNTPTLAPVPTPDPTSAPSATPSVSPTPPTQTPTSSPSSQPTSSPTRLPTDTPTQSPTSAPTQLPTSAPSLSPLSNAELKALMASRLRMTLGWSDVCGAGCTSGPTKFATVFDDSCVVTGVDSNCIPVPAQNRTFGGVNLDGTINFDDRLYLQLNASSLSCGLATDADCATGTPEQQAIYAMGFLCVAIGWRDVCSGCSLAPDRLSEWCVDTSLSTTLTGLGTLPGSLNLAGAPGDDDNFYISAFVHPSAPALPLLDYARVNCHVTLGWRDLCNGCFDPPFKRGSVRFDETCFDVVGSDSLCVGSYASVNADGAVTGDDVFYAALTCD